jgi:hypothetical protein
MDLKVYRRKAKRRVPQQQTFELPVESLARFRTVSKAWLATISDDPSFVRAASQVLQAETAPEPIVFPHQPQVSSGTRSCRCFFHQHPVLPVVFTRKHDEEYCNAAPSKMLSTGYSLEAYKVVVGEILFDMDELRHLAPSQDTLGRAWENVLWFDLISYTESLVPVTPDKASSRAL